MDDHPVLMDLERRQRESRARVLDMLHEAGRPDLAGELEAKLRDVATGVDGARGAWHALSAAQRRVLEALGEGRVLASDTNTSRGRRYHAIGSPHRISNICRLPTARNLCARELIAVDGGVFDPEAKFVLTERGRFVLAHGRS